MGARGKTAAWSAAVANAGAACRELNPSIFGPAAAPEKQRAPLVDAVPAAALAPVPDKRTTVAAGRVPNKTEQRFYDDHLDARVLAGEIEIPQYDALTFRIGEPGSRCTYRVDWAFWNPVDRVLELVEVKGGHVWEDALVKFQAARRLYPLARWTWARWVRRKGEPSRWEIKTYEPHAAAARG